MRASTTAAQVAHYVIRVDHGSLTFDGAGKYVTDINRHSGVCFSYIPGTEPVRFESAADAALAIYKRSKSPSPLAAKTFTIVRRTPSAGFTEEDVS